MQERLLYEIGNFVLLDSVFGFMAHVQDNFQVPEVSFKNDRALHRETLLFH